MAEPNTEATPAFENAEENDDVEYEEIDDEAAGSGGEEEKKTAEATEQKKVNQHPKMTVQDVIVEDSGYDRDRGNFSDEYSELSSFDMVYHTDVRKKFNPIKQLALELRKLVEEQKKLES